MQKELRRARRRRLEVRVKVNGHVENVSILGIMMHAIAQTMLLAEISSFCNLLRVLLR
jgi:2-keto-4-pentenoate hydratase/2-oxohepta-3-ene-1,7-dioic acid hydratase in catechol pathway